jgi:RNA polymerase sigma factor (sigma-70 family)
VEASVIQAPAFTPRRSVARPVLRLRPDELRRRSDEQLVALFRGGDNDAFEVIDERYRAPLMSYARQLLAASSADAEDMVQDALIRASGALRRDDRPVALRAWLYRVTHNRCIDHLRRREPPTSDVYDVSRTPASDPAAQTEAREELRMLLCDVMRLPEQQRSALLMHVVQDFRYAEIAKALRMSVPAVKSSLSRARASLADAGEARDAACTEIRSELADAHDRRVRMSGRSSKHVRDCAGCSHYHRLLPDRLGAAFPGHGAVSAIAKLLGFGGAGSGAAAAGGGAGSVTGASALGGGVLAAKLAAIVSCAAVVGTGAAIEIERHPGVRRAVHIAGPGEHPARSSGGVALVNRHAAPASGSVPVAHATPTAPRLAARAARDYAAEVLPTASGGRPLPRSVTATRHAGAPAASFKVRPKETGGVLAPDEPEPPVAPSDPTPGPTANEAATSTTPAAAHSYTPAAEPPAKGDAPASGSPATPSESPATEAPKSEPAPETSAPETEVREEPPAPPAEPSSSGPSEEAPAFERRGEESVTSSWRSCRRHRGSRRVRGC